MSRWSEPAMPYMNVMATSLLLSQLQEGSWFFTRLNLCHAGNPESSSPPFPVLLPDIIPICCCSPPAPLAGGQLQKLVPGYVCPYLTLGSHPSYPPHEGRRYYHFMWSSMWTLALWTHKKFKRSANMLVMCGSSSNMFSGCMFVLIKEIYFTSHPYGKDNKCCCTS